MEHRETPTIIDNRYKLVHKLGEGGMGTVYKAIDRLTGQPVALKRAFAPDTWSAATTLAISPDTKLALAREFQTLASLRHPHIISVMEYGFDEDYFPYFTMNLLDNPRNVVEAAHEQDFDGKIALLIQILQALTYLHRQGVLHRDLKPSNILVERSGKIKLVDFGLAVKRQSFQHRAGTLAYMAPEVFQYGEASTQSDLYAVGIMAYEFFTGRYPFVWHSIDEVARAITELVPDLTPLPEGLQFLISRLLEKDLRIRYASAGAVIRDISKFLSVPPPPETLEIRESFLHAARFVGREGEIRYLNEQLVTAIKGNGSAWIIIGESGIGKTRLLKEFQVNAGVAGALVLRGQTARDKAMPYHLWLAVLRRLVLHVPVTADEAAVLKEILPEIATLLEREIPAAPRMNGQEGQTRLMKTILAIFRRLTRTSVLILEDLQWIREEDLYVLHKLIEVVGTLPLLIVCAYTGRDIPDFEAHLPGVQVLPLRRLSPENVRELSQAMMGRASRRADVTEFLQQQTEGNALFLIEAAHVLAEQAGQLDRINGRVLPEDLFAGGMTEFVMPELIRRRLARVPAAAQATLRQAAVIGRELNLTLMRAIHPTIDADDWLMICYNAAIIDFTDGAWQFRHDRLRDVLLEGMSADERPHLHRLAAEAIERAFAGDDRYAAALVEHWHAAGDLRKESVYARVAARFAARLCLYEQAQRYLGRSQTFTLADDAGELPHSETVIVK